nr:MAG TPA: hypothetical protein [Caudoviricetes sp.]
MQFSRLSAETNLLLFVSRDTFVKLQFAES